MSASSIAMAVFGFAVLYGGLAYFLRVAMRERGL